jgi:hypothetical protein
VQISKPFFAFLEESTLLSFPFIEDQFQEFTGISSKLFSIFIQSLKISFPKQNLAFVKPLIEMVDVIMMGFQVIIQLLLMKFLEKKNTLLFISFLNLLVLKLFHLHFPVQSLQKIYFAKQFLLVVKKIRVSIIKITASQRN